MISSISIGASTKSRMNEPAARSTRPFGSRRTVLLGMFLVLWTAPLAVSSHAQEVSPPTDWRHVPFPVHCIQSQLQLLQAKSVPRTSNPPSTIILLHCDWEDGTGPAALLVYSTAAPRPRLEQTLLSFSNDWVPVESYSDGRSTFLGVGPGRVSLRVRGYSTSKVPRCCADVSATLSWSWKTSKFVEVGGQPRHV